MALWRQRTNLSQFGVHSIAAGKRRHLLKARIYNTVTTMIRLRRGQIVAVTFLDHCEGGSLPLAFTVYGRLAAVTETCLTIIGWEYAEKTKRFAVDRNTTPWNILRSCISQIVHLKEVS